MLKLAAMGADNRDWYREWWRKKTGYVERASFRVGHDEHVRAVRDRKAAVYRSAWRRNIFLGACVVVALVALAVFRS